MSTYTIDGLKILEVGCGLGLPSLVLQKRKAHITATDFHPSASSFLQENAISNKIDQVPFQIVDWTKEDNTIGQFDLIIGSDLFYEVNSSNYLATFLDQHLNPGGKIILVNPQRSLTINFILVMNDLGLSVEEIPFAFPTPDAHTAPTGRVLFFEKK
ncbi:MAG: class I SAM-dependent methyltransferase [Bacteriovoracaceae bacterium]|jgi:2-polyprenyl-3-methyl-5-hydroxy-6-metoxy-1,4-benzoquinol methylase|nr:class I SAM-dependent methyltransferase [Bacteriovoracaceae bacterium]